jgi:hypothetical protein
MKKDSSMQCIKACGLAAFGVLGAMSLNVLADENTAPIIRTTCT